MLIPSDEEVRRLLEETRALRRGHFALPGGEHTDAYVSMALAVSLTRVLNRLAVGLSRLVRAVPAVAAHLPRVSVVTPSTPGIPVGFAVGEALGAERIYWSERHGGRWVLRHFVEPQPGERVVLVDDITRQGDFLIGTRQLLERAGAQVIAIGVLIDMGNRTADFGGTPYRALTAVPNRFVPAGQACPMCAAGEPLTRVEIE